MRPHHEEPLPPGESGGQASDRVGDEPGDRLNEKVSQANPLLGESRVVRETPHTTVVRSEVPPAEGSSPRIYGPSFLGLNDEYSDSGSDYLLEEEPPRRGVSLAGWAFLLLLVGLGAYTYLHWNDVRASAAAYAEKYGLIQKQQPPAEVASNQPSSISTTNAEGEAAAQNPDAQKSAQAGEADQESSTTAENLDQANGAEAAPAQKPDENAAEKPESDEGTEAASAKSSDASEKKSDESRSAEKPGQEPVKKRTSKAEDMTAEPAAPAVTYDEHKLELAQKYLQGKGVEQNCDLGVRLLRSAADEPNPHAKIQMGALYLTGHCVQRDQAQAYHWFSQAYSLDPGNSWVEKNLTEIWARMTPEERKRAER